MRRAMRLLSAFLAFVLIINITVFNMWAEDGISDESYDVVEEIDDVDQVIEECENEYELIDDGEYDLYENADSEIDDDTGNDEANEKENNEADDENSDEYELTAEITDEVISSADETESQEEYGESTEDAASEAAEESSEESSEDSESSESITYADVGANAAESKVFDSLTLQSNAGDIYYTVTLELNGGTLSDDAWENNAQTVVAAGSVTLPDSTQVSQKGAVLTGWSDSSGTVTYAPGDAVTNITADIKLYAVWEWEKHSVQFVQSVDDDEALWTVEIEYGSRLWNDRSDTPWNDDDVNWTDDGSGNETADVELSDGTVVTVTKNTNTNTISGNNFTFTYYTFEYNSTRYFTAADDIIPPKSGFTFRDWYMTTPNAGGTYIEGDTVYIARYIDTGGYIANINYRYASKKTAADSVSLVVDYDEDTNTDGMIYAEITAPVIEGYTAVIASSSSTGTALLYDSDYVDITTNGISYSTGSDDDYLYYTVRIDINNASFTGIDGEEAASDAKIHYITFNIIYSPVATSYRINYYRETVSSTPTTHSGEYELYEWGEAIYDSTTGTWTKTWYTAKDGATLESTAYTTVNNEGETVTYYVYADDDYEAVSTETITDADSGYYNGDIVYPDTSVTYDGFIVGTGSLAVISEGITLASTLSENTWGLFYNRLDYHLYYITDSDSADIGNVLYVYGDEVSYPDESAIVKQGYVMDTTDYTYGLIYYTDVPSSSDGADNSSLLLNGTGEKPDTMPACDVYAKIVWVEAAVTYTVNIWLEAANYNHYVVEGQFTMDATTGDVLDRDEIVAQMEAYYDGTGDSTSVGYQIAAKADSTIGTDMRHFTFNASYTGNDSTNDAEITVKYDNSTDISILYDRNWYTLEMVLGRTYTQTTTGFRPTTITYYQVASATNGTFNCTWTNTPATGYTITSLPSIGYDSSVIDTVDCGNYTYYRITDGIYSESRTYSDGSSIYLGPYGMFTSNHVITYNNVSYTCATYYICAKWGADISALWPANNNSIYVNYPTGIGTYKYVSLGTNSSSMYYASNDNKNILNVYSTMSDEILENSSGNILTMSDAGYTVTLNVDGKSSTEANATMRYFSTINHRMIAYWNNPYEYYYYRLVEAIDGTITDSSVKYTIADDAVGGTGSGSNVSITSLSDGNIVKWNGKYYIVTGTPTTQYSSNYIYNQTQPAISGYESMGKAYYTTSSNRLGGNVYFLYDRERYDLSLSNRGSTTSDYYHLPTSALDYQFTTSDGTTTTLRSNGFEVRDGSEETVDGVECCQLSVKYGTNSEYLEYVTDYMLSITGDSDDYDNYLKLAYSKVTKGSKDWTFDEWYQDADHKTYAWADNATYTLSAYCSFTIYASWTAPEYSVNFYMGRGSYTDADNILGYLWINADTPNENRASQITYGYTYSVSEGDYVDRPYSPSLYGYSFIGWYYFVDNGHSDDNSCRVMLEDVVSSSAELSLYSSGQTYSDSYGVVRLIQSDENGDLYYCSETRGMRYIFGETSPIYEAIDLYTAWKASDDDEYDVWHIIEKSQIDDEGITVPSDWMEITINDTEYYIVTTEQETGKKTDTEYTVYSQYDISVTNGTTTYYLLPGTESTSVVMDISLYPYSSSTSDTVEYDSTGYSTENVFYSDESSSYVIYVLMEYSIASVISYTVWYVDIDEAIALGDLADENSTYTRYETPSDTSNTMLLPADSKTESVDLGTTGTTLVTETAKDIQGYTLIGDWQTSLNLLSSGDRNNIYFYYRKQESDSVYNIKFYIMDEYNNYNSSRTIEINNMPGVSGTDVDGETLAKYYERYLQLALAQTDEINGSLPSITVSYDGDTYYYGVDGETDYTDIVSLCAEILQGTVNDAEMSTPYILIAVNDADKEISVYMRYGSIKLIKYADDGSTLEGAKFTLTQYDEAGDATGVVYYAETDNSGEYVFYNLWLDQQYTYVLEETTAPGDGYQLLEGTVSLSVPYVSDTPLNNEYDYYDEDTGLYYWYDINCEVTDAVKFTLPVSGGHGNVVSVFVGLGLIYAAVMLMMRNRKRLNTG